MANISIRNLSDSIKAELQLQAAAAGCSLEEFLRRCLTAAAVSPSAAKRALLFGSKGGGQAGNVYAADRGIAPAALVSETAAEYVAGMARPTASAARAGKNVLAGKNILLIIGGSVAAYKCLELIRLLRAEGAQLRVIMTAAAQQFITPLAVGAVAGGRVYSDLFSRADEQDIGHIRLARNADMVLFAAVSASRMAKMAAGIGDDLAGAAVLATHAPVFLAPAMNPAMWQHKATQRNLAVLRGDGCHIIGPESGAMAESGERGLGRMSEPAAILHACAAFMQRKNAPLDHAAPKPLAGRHIIITSGATQEPLDPIRYISNHSSGKQGHGLAAALAALGARVTLISGSAAVSPPAEAETVAVTTAREMRAAVFAALPADAAIFVAAVADWRPLAVFSDKLKKLSGDEQEDVIAEQGIEQSGKQIKLILTENPDILAAIGHLPPVGDVQEQASAAAENTQPSKRGAAASNGARFVRPQLVIGFAAETRNLLKYAKEKLEKKGADWIIANNVAGIAGKSSAMGSDENTVAVVTRKGVEQWGKMPKAEISAKLAERIAMFFHTNNRKKK